MSEQYKEILNDYVCLLKCGYQVYDIRDNLIIQEQIKTIASKIKSSYDQGKITGKTIDTIKLYINNLLTDDELIIIPEGKVLLEILQ